jgi:hypothetical protein
MVQIWIAWWQQLLSLYFSFIQGVIPLFGVFQQNGNATNSKGILYFAKFSTYACGSP